jgi:hypothetical protein
MRAGADLATSQWSINSTNIDPYPLPPSEIWNQNLEEVKKYIKDNNKKPSRYDDNNEVKNLGSWISGQIGNYKNKKNCMKEQEIILKPLRAVALKPARHALLKPTNIKPNLQPKNKNPYGQSKNQTHR